MGSFCFSACGITQTVLKVGITFNVVNKSSMYEYFPGSLPFHTCLQETLYSLINGGLVSSFIGAPRVLSPTTHSCVFKCLSRCRVRILQHIRNHLCREEASVNFVNNNILSDLHLLLRRKSSNGLRNSEVD